MEGALSQRGMRSRNELLILRAVRDKGPLSRAQLSDRLGMTRMGVGRIVASLMERRLLVETETIGGQPGRPHVLLDMDRTSWAVVGIDMRVDRTRIMAADLSGSILAEDAFSFASVPGPREAAETIRAACDRLRNGLSQEVGGVAIALPAQLSEDRRVVVESSLLGWRDAQFADAFEAGVAGTPVAYRHVAECAAIANAWAPGFADVDRLLHLQVGAGTGMAITRGRNLDERWSPGSGTGHIPLGNSADLCSCGRRGCLDASIGFDSFLQATKSSGVPLKQGPDAMQSYAAAIGRRADSDGHAKAAIEGIADVLARTITVLASLESPQAVTLGGYPLAIGAPLLKALDERLAQWFGTELPLRESPLGDDASTLGAVQVAVDEFLGRMTAVPPALVAAL